MRVIRQTLFCLTLLFSTLLGSIAYPSHQTANTVITVKLSPNVGTDSLQLIVFGRNFLGGLPTIPQSDMQTVTAPVIDGACHFSISLHATPHYYLIKENRGSLIESEYVVVPKNILTGGNDVCIEIGDNRIDFSGNGAQKMARFNELPVWCSNARDSISQEIIVPAFSNKELTYVYHYFEQSNRLSKLWINRIRDERHLYSDAEYQLLLADGIGYIQYSPVFALGIKALLNKSFSSDETDQITSLMERKIIDLTDWVSDTALGQSDNWIKFVDNWVTVGQKLKHGSSFARYTHLKETFSGNVRDKLILLYLIQNAKHIAEIDSLAQDFIGITQNESYKDLLSQSTQGRTKGKKAKDFLLFDEYGNSVKLTDFYGKVVFLDFWFPGCVPCIQYFGKTISYAEEKFKNNPNVVFISVGIHANKEKWLDALKTNKYSSPSAINLFTGNAGWKHPVISDYAITSAPTPILIDKRGHIYATNSSALGMEDRERLIDIINECSAQ